MHWQCQNRMLTWWLIAGEGTKMYIKNECRFNASFLTFPSTFSLWLHVTVCGVTRVGVTQDCNWVSPLLTTFFSHHHLSVNSAVSPVFIFSWKTNDFLCSSLELLLISIWCHPAGGCHPALFHLSNLVCPLFFVNSPKTFFFVRVSPPGRCHPGRSAPWWRHCSISQRQFKWTVIRHNKST